VVNAVTAALFYKERHGKGQEIEVPMYETMVSFVMAEHQWGQTFEPAIGKAGYVRLMSEHRRPYKTKDGYIAVLPYWDNHWKTFCTIVERPDMLSDPRFKDMQSRLTNIGASYAETGKALFKKTTAEWLEILEPTNVPHMIVNTLDGLIDDPQLVESGFWQLHDHPTEGKIRMAKSPYNFSETPTDITRLPPRLGEQSEEILREAGYSDDEIYKMFELGVTKRPN
jgi:crotonobetainyl-CoA:carnitine CoA-transferase CaiB-like acyl-CoA transferase